MKKALCIISGGMDSTLCAYLAKKEKYDIIALHFDYNQRTMRKERECFEKICKELDVKNKYILDVSFIADIGNNSLTDFNLTIPKNELHKNELPNTYVPFRNGIFLSIAGAIAEKENCESIFIGVVQEDSSGYPDCSQNFIQDANKFINSGTSKNFKTQIKTPLIKLSKAQIVALAIQENVALKYTWSCYEKEDKACGKCDSCLLRLKGFNEIGIKDEIEYE
ncbi:7-cyano-7-deazaguanine synthase QueC [Campylobacter volucris]|uniref:7-cyano-7-deazaguanine synthase n=2 Tax=Campylobacter volucris TaxID=1031542 RepID=A0AAE5YJ30_9BACT|nr:7-cyano-7-deazaguanine synthase QueC [Campylobacter volucris]AJC94030.1 7-cyano-7-deazaguanine synthase [Campylobacter volucris LMG 24379]KAB0580191.1 7-cyano-7-deazaguanine synthase QueC [Campylobacter volucris]MBF7042976.1 7-cyano-7-deazaguanine synthase QueC [Campylobacter volucris]MBF7044158.1 7-cyano-7-deazaguanine synthase QueC [Campylobacter volucris]MBF7069352.1 7-cyano-7-deazaguanine synthase QueC [Campylobacter volucris]